MKNIKKLALILAPFFLLLAITLLTDPYKLPLFLLVVPFLLLGIGSYAVLVELLRMGSVSRKKRKAIAAILTSILLLGVLLQSIRQLSVKDLLILLVLLAGVTFYVRRIDI